MAGSSGTNHGSIQAIITTWAVPCGAECASKVDSVSRVVIGGILRRGRHECFARRTRKAESLAALGLRTGPSATRESRSRWSEALGGPHMARRGPWLLEAYHSYSARVCDYDRFGPKACDQHFIGGFLALHWMLINSIRPRLEVGRRSSLFITGTHSSHLEPLRVSLSRVARI